LGQYCNFTSDNFVEIHIFENGMRIRFLLLCLLLSKLGVSQIGGLGTYQFLNVSSNARIAALGGSAISTPDADINLVSFNPSLLKKENHNQVGLNFVNYFTDISAGELNYARHFDSLDITFASGIQYINYGNFVKTAPDGQVLGDFSAGEYNLHFTAAKTIKKINYGATLKLIYSNLETYYSSGAAVDLGANWISNDKLMLVTAMVSNVGTQFKSYTNDNYENIPYNVQLGFSKKFEHNPFRFGVILHNLQNPGKLLYQIDSRQQISLETGAIIPDDFTLVQKAMSHVIINTELILGKSLNIRFGYNAMRQRELALNNIRGFNGFSWGFGIRLNRFQCSYGYGGYMPGKNTNTFSIVTRLDDFKRSKKTTD
jgi:hypothetical protein